MAFAGIGHKAAEFLLCIVAAVERTVAVADNETGVELKLRLVFVGVDADAVLLVEGTPCPTLRQFGVALDFDAPALVIGQVQVQAVHLVVGQHVHLLLQVFQAIEVPAAVEHQSAPLVAGIVGDGECRQLFAVLGTELGEGFAGVLQAGGALGYNVDALARQRQTVLVGMVHTGIDAATLGGRRCEANGARMHLHLHRIGDDMDVPGMHGEGDKGKQKKGEDILHCIDRCYSVEKTWTFRSTAE